MVPPFHTTLLERFDPRKKENFYKMILNLGKQYNLFIFDYSDDIRFLNNDTYFSNADHLNKEGARVFTEIFLADLREKFNLKKTNMRGAL
jgi:hypothetical protein